MNRQTLFGACLAAAFLTAMGQGSAFGQGLFDGLFGGGGNQRNNNSWGSSGSNRVWVPDNDSGDGDGHYENKPTYGGGRNYNNDYRNNNNNGVDWLRLGIDLIDAAGRADRANQQRNYNNGGGRSYNRYDDDDYYYDNQQPRTYRPAPPKKVAVKANKKPKKVEAKAPLRLNGNPLDNSIETLSTEEAEMIQQLSQQDAEEKMDEVKKNLGDKYMDPAVKAAYDKMKQDVQDGKAIDPADVQALQDAVNADTMFSLPADEKLGDAMTAAGAASQLNESLLDKLNNPGNPPPFPFGLIDLISVPGLPADDLSMYPDGSLVMGTGGQGELGITEVDGSELLDFPVGAGEPTPDSESNFDKRVTSGVLLLNPEANEDTIHYLINDKNYSMAPKFSQPLDGDQKWTVRFDRGEDNGEAKYSLTNGSYAFGSSDRGWELYRQTFSVKVDNTAGQEPFYYNFDNKQSEVAAGQVASHTSDYPIFIRFDRGNGKEAKKKVLTKDAVFQGAVNPEDGYWELYPGDAKIQVADSSDAGEATEKVKGKAKKPSSRAAKLRRMLLLSQKAN